jgi:hypothetical protein
VLVISDNTPGKTLEDVAKDYGMDDTLPSSKPNGGKPVDFTTPAIFDAKSIEALRAKMGRGRRSTFLTGPNGLTSPPALGRTLLGGG